MFNTLSSKLLRQVKFNLAVVSLTSPCIVIVMLGRTYEYNWYMCCYCCNVLFKSTGALPPDLTFVVLARERNEDYVFSYLMGYQDPPAGIEVPDGQYYNVYFPGQGTSMAPPLFNDMITYEDGMLCVFICCLVTLAYSSKGTPASASQMAKDISTFLRWSTGVLC